MAEKKTVKKTVKKASIKKSAAKKSASKKAVKKVTKKTAIKKGALKKTVAKKTNTKRATKSRSKRKSNLLRLCSIMNKMTSDAVDKEIIRRFKIIIDTSEEDITKTQADEILKEPETIVPNSYHESLQPYIKHYLFMLKRSKKHENND